MLLFFLLPFVAFSCLLIGGGSRPHSGWSQKPHEQTPKTKQNTPKQTPKTPKQNTQNSNTKKQTPVQIKVFNWFLGPKNSVTGRFAPSASPTGGTGLLVCHLAVQMRIWRSRRLHTGDCTPDLAAHPPGVLLHQGGLAPPVGLLFQ